MAIYTTFFLCKPEELLGGFPGWRSPLVQPVRREFRNPFTGEVSVVETCEPEWPDEANAELDRGHQVVAVQGRYEDYLESRLPPFVRARPHWAAKGLTEVEVDPLLKAARVEADPPLAEKEREELQRLRQQVRTLRMERDILKKATAFFAKHSV